MENNNKKISFLIGAGFSEPMGYPLGEKMNKNIKSVDISILDHILTTVEYEQAFANMQKMKRFFLKEYDGEFDYELFYDYICNTELFKKIVNPNAQKYTNEQHQVKLLYQGIVAYNIKDDQNRQFYDNTLQEGQYKDFLDVIAYLQEKYEIKFHTLNHDLLLEGLLNKRNIPYCDGFEKLNSPYYGKKIGKLIMSNLERFTNNYTTKNQLFKIHGSIDYYLYYKEDIGYIPDKIIKTKQGVDISTFERIENKDNRDKYPFCLNPYFLTGKDAKEEQYKNPILYSQLTSHFKQNLRDSELLIVIGYGCKDSKINTFIRNNFSKEKKCFIVDTNPEIVDKFMQETGIEAQFINGIENISEIIKKENSI